MCLEKNKNKCMFDQIMRRMSNTYVKIQSQWDQIKNFCACKIYLFFFWKGLSSLFPWYKLKVMTLTMKLAVVKKKLNEAPVAVFQLKPVELSEWQWIHLHLSQIVSVAHITPRPCSRCHYWERRKKRKWSSCLQEMLNILITTAFF